MTLEELQEKIEFCNPNMPTKIVYIPKAQKSFLLAFTKDTPPFRTCKILVMDEIRCFAPIAQIWYQITESPAKPYSKSLYDDNQTVSFEKQREYYIAHFHTNYNYQGQGIGKYIYQLAQAHMDCTNINNSYGVISPLDDIKGVTKSGIDSEKAERKFLALMYHALGNTVIETKDNEKPITQFRDSWTHNQKYENLNSEQKEFVNSILKFEHLINTENNQIIETKLEENHQK